MIGAPSSVSELWSSTDEGVWNAALDRYWGLIKPANLELERAMEDLTPKAVEVLDRQGWYDFLHDRYFRWKYTAPNRYATTTACLRRQVDKIGLDGLLHIRDCILTSAGGPTARALSTTCEIGGLGPAGASGLLALLYPKSFATIDQFVAKALAEVPSLPQSDLICGMSPEGLSVRDGVVLIEVMRAKAAALNATFGSQAWTPRKIDKVLWAVGR